MSILSEDSFLLFMLFYSTLDREIFCEVRYRRVLTIIVNQI